MRNDLDELFATNKGIMWREGCQGSCSEEYINHLLDELEDSSAGEIAKCSADPDECGVHIEAVLENVSEYYVCQEIVPEELDFGTYISFEKCSLDELEYMSHHSFSHYCWKYVDLYFFIKELRYGYNHNPLMKKLLSVNYGAFRLAAIKRFTDRYHNEESKRLTMSIDKFVNYPDKRTVISVINDFYDVIMSHWFPDKSINDFKNQVLEGYQRIDDELFRLFYFACGRDIDFVEKDAY